MKNLFIRNIHGFKLVDEQYIHELKATGYLLEHIKSGARLFYVDADDTNKVFSVSFRTPPKDSTGVAHIIEHSVLCGSRKFPLKEPFVELVKGSLNTFLNAMTFPDKTMYPVASKNDQDFRNLMDVYLDAVFYPRVINTPEIVMQEGWHYELDSPEAEMTYKGVVYNEMKGVYSTPTSILDKKVMEALFKDTTYGVDSGGDPDYITDLTFESFVEFYKKNYHPSNSYFFLYGRMDIEEQLRFINEEYLQNFDRISVDSQIALQKPFNESVVLKDAYNISSEENEIGKTMHSFTYAFPPATPAFNLAFEVLNYVIVGSAAAPLRELLVKEGVGTDITGAYTDGIYQPTWGITVTGSEEKEAARLKEIVINYLTKVVKQGLDKKALEAALNYFEFMLREADFGGHPVGLIYNIRAMGSWLYDGNPYDALRYEDALIELREGIHNGLFEKLIKEYILENNHNVLMTLYPKKGLTAEKTAREKEFLAEKKANLTQEQVKKIVNETKLLKERQAAVDTPEALATIPLLELGDLNIKAEKVEARSEKINESTLHFVPTNTNGIAYLNLYFDLDVLTEEELPYANLLSNVLRRMNTAYHSYADVEKMVQFSLGGLSFDTFAIPIIRGEKQVKTAFAVRGKALANNISELWKIIDEIINYTIYDDEVRLSELVAELKAICDMKVLSDAHTIASTKAIAPVSDVDKFKDTKGLGYFEFLADAVNEQLYAEIGKKLKDVAKKIFTTKNLDILFTGEEESYQEFIAETKNTISKWEDASVALKPITYSKKYVNEGIATSTQVQYVAQGGNFKQHGHKFNGSMKVLEMILRYEYLWTKIRVQGGAYGAFATFSPSGKMVFCSYRDPNLGSTLEVYEKMAEYIKNISLSEREMRKYIIGTMSGLDTPITPYLRGARYMQMYFAGTNEKDLEQIYREVVSTNVNNLQVLATVVEAVIKDNHICVLGNEEKVREAVARFDEIVALPQ